MIVNSSERALPASETSVETWSQTGVVVLSFECPLVTGRPGEAPRGGDRGNVAEERSVDEWPRLS
jgi:hypothetical protein